MSKRLTLEEQRDEISKLITSNSQQYAAKIAVLDTLNRLLSLRRQIEKGPGQLDDNRFAEDLAAVLGDSPTLKGS